MMEKHLKLVKREIVINATPEKVWKALTIPSERNKWETQSCEMELRTGGEAFFDYGWNTTYRCKIKEVIENERIVFENDDNSLSIWTLEKLDNETKVTAEITGLWIGDLAHYTMDNMAFGTYQFMRNLKSVIEKEEDIRSSFWKSWIGVSHTAQSETIGTKVVRVKEGTPAYGFLETGDIITAVDGQNVHSHDDFEIYVTEKGAEKEIYLDVIRSKKQLKVCLKTVPFGAVVTR
jgi:uncharacterized protein YndB with AHSA1/START domain